MLSLIRSITPAMRLSVAIGLSTLSIVLVASSLGLIPNAQQLVGQSRVRLGEALALQLSIALEAGDEESVSAVAATMMEHTNDLRGIAMRTVDGELSFATGGTETWAATETAEEKEGTGKNLRVPIYRGDERWGTAEFRFTGKAEDSSFMTAMRLSLFTGLLTFLFCRFYLHRVLKYLDPSSVIPERVKAMLDTMSEGVVVLDNRENIILANEAFIEFSQMSLKELQGRKASQLKWLVMDAQDPETATPFPWREAASEGRPIKGVEMRLKRGDEDPQVFMVNSSPILGGEGKCRGALATFDDVTAIEEKNARLEEMVNELQKVRNKVQRQNEELQLLATRDSLTGCFNRRALFEKLQEAWESSQRYQHPLSLIMLDIDHFKSVNDNHGHGVGDQVLERVSQCIRDTVRNTDTVGRYGGEEFCIILPHTEIEAAKATAEKVRKAIEESHPAGLDVTSSFGVSELALGAESPRQLVEQADQALYVAKSTGRNRSIRWDLMPDVPEDAEQPQIDPSQASERTAIPYQAVAALMSALRHRDAGTAAHCERVADLCMLTSRGLMSAGDSFVLEVAALLHDIGKIGVPDSILLKPGSLTEDEWKVMETHDRIGIEIISSAFHCPELTAIVRNHHASFGGGARDPGLPVGRDIPIRARILTIADAYDAMVSDRVYRKAMSQEDAFAELRRCAPEQFDPELIERFIDAVASRDAGRPVSDVDASTDIVLNLGLAVERLMAALDINDLKMLEAMADRLGDLARYQEWAEIAEASTRLVSSIGDEQDVEDLLAASRDLVGLCHEMQNDLLDDGSEQDQKAAAA
jgi:diguanylate cyclase (GGDEF)-like protein/putative nucleotidyltransferase with HDIG domain/PAS domain S-box-containing protein